MSRSIRPVGVRLVSDERNEFVCAGESKCCVVFSDGADNEAKTSMGKRRDGGTEVDVCVKMVRRPSDDNTRTPNPDVEGVRRAFCKGMSARRRPINVNVPPGVGSFTPRRIRSKGSFFSAPPPFLGVEPVLLDISTGDNCSLKWFFKGLHEQ